MSTGPLITLHDIDNNTVDVNILGISYLKDYANHTCKTIVTFSTHTILVRETREEIRKLVAIGFGEE